MKFRDDIDPANTWVVSDTHFGHDNIVGFCHRPLDHEQVMIAEWRKEVPDDATLLHLGDLAYRSNARFKHITAKELTGVDKKIILGNHDRQRYSFYKDAGFQVCKPFAITVAAQDEDGVLVPKHALWTRPATGLVLSAPVEFDSTYDWVVSFSHYPWGEEDRQMFHYDLRLHGHIHNNGYSRGIFTPFLRGHINLSVEQTKYKPVNLKVLLEAYLLGVYQETTQAELDEASDRRAANLEAKDKPACTCGAKTPQLRFHMADCEARMALRV